MAKNPLIDPNLFAKTSSPEPAPVPQGVTENPVDYLAKKKRKRNAEDPIKAYGIGLRSSQWVKFFKIAEEMGTNYHDLGVHVLTVFLDDWDHGIRPPTETKQVLKRP